MKIIEYENKYLDDVKDLLVELEEYIITIDKDHLDQLHPDYREKMVVNDFKYLNDGEGKCFVAVDDDKAIGLIMGCVVQYDEYDYLDYTCPKIGDVIELVVSKKVRSKGIGQQLMKVMEDYFKSIGCKWIKIDVFAYNENAIKFYDKQGYHQRMYIDIKKID